MSTDFLPTLDAALAPVIDSARVTAMRAYMRDQVDYVGIGSPQRCTAARPLLKNPGRQRRRKSDRLCLATVGIAGA